MNTRDYVLSIVTELERTLNQISVDDAEGLVARLLAARHIVVAGAGRTGLAMKGFAMRLMHLGFAAYVVGETVTPKFSADDLLLIGSGSGETGSLLGMAQKAGEVGGGVALVTIFPESSIGRLADLCVRIPAPTPKTVAFPTPGATSIQPMGSLFEQSLFIFLDIVVLKLMEKTGSDSSRMFERHANLE